MILAHRVRFMVTLFVSIILCPVTKTTGDSTGLWTFELCSTGGNSFMFVNFIHIRTIKNLHINLQIEV